MKKIRLEKDMSQGDIGGPDSEVFFEFTQVKHDVKFGKKCHPNCQCGRFLEIGNSVFIQYTKKDDSTLEELPQRNVDFGGGLERLVAATNDDPDIFMTDLLKPVMDEVVKSYFSGIFDESLKYPGGTRIFSSNNEAEEFKNRTKKSVRIVADHMRASVFMVKEGIIPSNKGAGYVLRKLIRRSIVKLEPLRRGIITDGSNIQSFDKVIDAVINVYKDLYFQNEKLYGKIIQTIGDEVANFGKTFRKGLKVVENTEKVSGKIAFNLYQTYGFPLEVTTEIFSEKGQEIDEEEFKKEFEKHKEKSRTASAGMFKGGLADHSEEVKRLHTATHLLQAALRKVLGKHVEQKGQNITSERSRFDFSYDKKLTEKQLIDVEDWINDKVSKNLPVKHKLLEKEEAKKTGAIGLFEDKYGDNVNVYYVGESLTNSVSKEFCGGPHVKRTSEIGHVRIRKQEKIGAGIVRIYVVLELDDNA